MLEAAGADHAVLGARSVAGDPDTAVVNRGTLVQTSDAAWSAEQDRGAAREYRDVGHPATPEATTTGHTAFSQPTRLLYAFDTTALA